MAFPDALKKVVEDEYGPLDKMTAEQKTDAFYNTHKMLMVITGRCFQLLNQLDIAEIKLDTEKK